MSPVNPVATADSMWPRMWLMVSVAAIVGLISYVLTRTKPAFFDEVPYFAQAYALRDNVPFREWLRANDTCAAGPVHALMHFALSRGTGVLPVPWCRLPNLVILCAVLVLTALHLIARPIKFPWAVAMTGVAVPMTWIMAGMALTEMPAILGITIAVYAAVHLGEGKNGVAGGVLWQVLIAVGVGLALCGRQTYLVVIPAILLLGSGSKMAFIKTATAIGVGFIPAVLLYSMWGGMVPPKLAYVGAGVKPLHAVYAVCYCGIVVFLLSPSFFRAHWRLSLSVGVVVATINVFAQLVHFTMLTSFQRFFEHPKFGQVLENMMGWFFLCLGSAFVITICLECWINRNRHFIAYASGVLFLCAACAGIVHLFSSRYVGMTLPFLVPMIAPWVKFGPWSIARLLISMGLGASSLVSYYVYA